MADTQATSKKLFQAHLVGDVEDTGGSLIVEVGPASTDRALVESFCDEKNASIERDAEDEGWTHGETYVLYNTDFSAPPKWVVIEIEVLG